MCARCLWECAGLQDSRELGISERNVLLLPHIGGGWEGRAQSGGEGGGVC